MSTLTEIEAAVGNLPRREQRRLHALLSQKLSLRPAKKAPLNLHERMKDLCGSISSRTGDLSHKKKHLRLKGYGQ